MRRFFAASLSLAAAACATAPTPQQPATPAPASVHTRGGVVGLTPTELVHQLGSPALQIREGESLKLQFRSRLCVLDVYLYPSGSGVYRVTYVDARTPSLGTVDQALCIHSIEAP
ncbi:MAG TPA: hypothetical protein VFI88_00920 [Sphingomicrobium sp.]|jgi:hypothetical protein|nr:hypothetical protein [Sphingomicrobium sp.]